MAHSDFLHLKGPYCCIGSKGTAPQVSQRWVKVLVALYCPLHISYKNTVGKK